MPSLKTFAIFAVMVLATVWLFNRFYKKDGKPVSIASFGAPA